MSLSLSSSIPFIFLSILLIFSIVAKATVPASKTFKIINQGSFSDAFYAPNEYNAWYRTTGIRALPFSLCFYNTTPNAFTLGLRMARQPSDNPINFRWVWDANRGKPVGENAALTFGTDGNLVLSEAKGQIVWQTGTSNKGVVGLRLLSNGNLVLHDNRGKFVWQSFDHPTDTLLVGQGLRPSGPTRLVSRVSDVDGSEGPYSFVLEKKRLAMYLKSKNSKSPSLYYTNGENPPYQGSSPTMTMVFDISPKTGSADAYELRYQFRAESNWTMLLARPKYNSTYSFLRIGSDGDIKIYTFYDKVDWGAWEVTYSLFGTEGVVAGNECKLPKKCGSLGLCDKNQCVACPRPKGLKGWSESCAPPKLGHCKNGEPNNFDYYKVAGVEHFMSDYNEGEGPISLNKCKEKCNRYCECLAIFYKEESSKCLLVPELGTFNKVSNQSHVAYIKTPKYAKVAI
ncbi:Ep1-like glycoprotein [Thalictrum thalictroides]|uniref:Ep1-like glycoprotein n=1 Tax=Thalictrum thalictroides TaxID=46969 RepID=A0A7J6VUL8_THATH|nr:Ep1-like glycoprotein [Thalictrum thalictroides]